jgi:microcystin-dependent protein
MFRRIKQTLWGALFGTLIATQALGQATLLPNGVQQYLDQNGAPIASGHVDYFVPNTTTRKTTWSSSTESVGTQNPNPVLLNAGGFPQNGSGQINGTYGDGVYRQRVVDQNNNVIWDMTTSSTGSSGGGGGNQVALGDNAYVGDIHAFAGLVAPTNYMFSAGQAVSRTTYATLLGIITGQFNILCQSGIATVTVATNISDAVPIGAPFEAACFVPGTTVISKSSGLLTLSNNATSTVSVPAQVFPWGNGDGSTTFNLPYIIGKVLAGRDNLGGSVAGTLTAAFFGPNPDALGAQGGTQSKTLVPSNLPPITPTGTIANGAITSTVSGGTVGGTANNPTTQGAGGGASTPVNSAAIAVTSTQATSTFTGTGGGGSSAPVSAIPPTVTINYIIKVQADTISAGLIGITASLPLVATTTSQGIQNIALNVSGVTAASYGDGADIPVVTFDTFGRATAASATPSTPAMSNVTGVNTYVNGLAADTTPNITNDYLIMRRASDGAMVKINPTTIAGANTAGVSTVGGVSGAIGLGTGLSMVGSNITPAANVSSLGAQTGAITLAPGLSMVGSALTNTGYGGVFDAVRTYGADPTGVASSTTAINNAIAAACAAGVRGIVWIQPGTYLVNGGINATNISSGCTIDAGGLTGTSLTVSSSTNVILDMTGSSAVTVNNLQISDPSGFANYGILLSTSGTPSHPCNVNHFRGISLTGHWSQAGIYIYDCSDSSFENSQVSCFNTAASACVYHTATNDLGAASNFTTIITGTTQSGDWTYKSFEIHDLSHVSGASTVIPFYLSGSFSPIRYIGGVIAGSASSQGCVTLAGGVKGVTFIGIQMYGDNGTACVNGFFAAANVTGLVIQGSSMQYTTNLFSQNNAVLWTGLNETGNSFGGGSLFSPSGSTGLLTQSFVDAKGLAINMGAGGTVTHTIMLQPGTITAGTQSANGSF